MQTDGIALIGVGGGGSQIVMRLAGMLREPPMIGAIDTDAAALAKTTVATRLQIGEPHTRGFGAGGDVHLARLAANDDAEMIAGLVADFKLVVAVTSLGGGTGTAVTPVLLKAAREQGAAALCFATLPFRFEGRDRHVTADRAMMVLREAADGLVVVPNDRLFANGATGTMDQAFREANRVFASGLGGVWRLLTQPGYINLTLSDLLHLFRQTDGVCSLGFAETTGPGRAEALVSQLVKSPLTDTGRSLAHARSALVSIAGGSDLTLQEVGDIMARLAEVMPKDCFLSMGTMIDEAFQNRIAVTVVPSEYVTVPVGLPPKEGLLPAEPDEQEKPRRKPTKKDDAQPSLGLETSGKGRFKGVEPTVLDGEDLDTPTFIRRGIAIDR